MKRRSIRLVQATPAPKLIWLLPGVQTGETRMPAPAPAAPKRQLVDLRHQGLMRSIMLALAAAVASFWKSQGPSHQPPPLLRTPLIQNSSLPPNLLMDNVPFQIKIAWWLLASFRLLLLLSCCVNFFYLVTLGPLFVQPLGCSRMTLHIPWKVCFFRTPCKEDSRCTYEILPYSSYRGARTTTK